MDDFNFILEEKLNTLQLKAPETGPCEGHILEVSPPTDGLGRSATGKFDLVDEFLLTDALMFKQIKFLSSAAL